MVCRSASVSQHQWDNSYTPQVEWANVKYQLTSELSVRLGRIAAPTFLLSETRLVGYSNPWVRPPVEVYGASPITSNDGVDATYRRAFGAVNNTFQGDYGNRTVKQVGGGTTKITSAWGLNDSAEYGSLTARVGYNAGAVSIDSAASTRCSMVSVRWPRACVRCLCLRTSSRPPRPALWPTSTG